VSDGRAADVAAAFTAWTGGPPEGVWAAPGRVNLIGEHLDYNGGHVLPFAIDLAARVAVRRRRDGGMRCHSVQLDATAQCRAEEMKRVTGWAAHVAGAVWALAEEGVGDGALDVWLDSEVPIGAGLASSAAVGCAVALAVADLAGAGLDFKTLARVVQRGEQEVVGAPVGLMDQTASLQGRAGHAVALDCRTGRVGHVPLDPAVVGLSLLVVDTGTAHELRDGSYGQRRAECEAAAAFLGVDDLALVDPAAVAGGVLPAPSDRRARHVVSEEVRTVAAVAALRAGDLPAVGPFMTASHRSLRDDFEVSTPALDAVVEAALAAGALGARLTGGGFGGSVLVLAGDEARRSLVERYPQAIQVRPAAGARRCRL
jgi:galactokinase